MNKDEWLRKKPDWMRGLFVSTMVGQDKPVIAILTIGGTYHLGMGEIPNKHQRENQEKLLGFKWTILEEGAK